MGKVAELLGTMFLTMTVVGSGIMAENLTEDVAIQLLINAAATVAILYILINLIAPISGAHFNPVVTMIAAFRGAVSVKVSLLYLLLQFAGAILGTLIANAMFAREVLEASTNLRSGSNQFFSEIIATFGLVTIIFAEWSKMKVRQRATLISLWIGAAYFFTSSTSFANPAVTVGRAFTDSFSGIAPESVPAFLGAQAIGAFLALALVTQVNGTNSKLTRRVKE